MIALRRPSPGAITSDFGPREPGAVGSTYHEGIDFGWGNGWTITAAAAGVVTFAGYRAGYGNLTIIDHGHGVETRYAHQSSISVVVGERVVAGEAIGVIGNTGTSAGAHLHFELWINGRKVNPMPYFTSTAGDDITPIRRKTMTTLFQENRSKPTRYALAGDGAGEAAWWEFTGEPGLVKDLEAVHGPAVPVSDKTFAQRKRAYTSRATSELDYADAPPAGFTFTGTATPA